MNYARILLASLCAFVAYFIYGSILFGALPWLRNEYAKYPAVYRSQEGIKRTMPYGMLAMFLALVAIAVLYAMVYSGGQASLKVRASEPSSASLRSVPLSSTTTST
jgi:hypothetical protein